MLDLREPKYQWGQRVVAVADLVNDGSYPEAAPEEILIAGGTEGEVVQTGMHTDTNTPIYLVEFPGGKVLGCLEEEIAPA